MPSDGIRLAPNRLFTDGFNIGQSSEQNMMDTEDFFRHVGLVGYSVRESKSVWGNAL